MVSLYSKQSRKFSQTERSKQLSAYIKLEEMGANGSAPGALRSMLSWRRKIFKGFSGKL